jgi:hypothetical protein
MGAVQLAVKCPHDPTKAKVFLTLAERHRLTAVEVAADSQFIRNVPFEKRVVLLSNLFRGKVSRLCFHVPTWFTPENSTAEMNKCCDLAGKRNDSAVALVSETIMEAAEVGARLNLEVPVLVNLHLLGLACLNEVSLASKLSALENGRNTLNILQKYVTSYCNLNEFKSNGKPLVKLVRENNPPMHNRKIYSLIDFHPEEFTNHPAVGVNLDFAHFHLYLNYVKAGHGESPGADLDSSLYSPPSWEATLKQTKDMLEMVHLCDAKGYTPKHEGLIIGKGDINFRETLLLLCQHTKTQVFGTLEIINPNNTARNLEKSIDALHKMFRSDYKSVFI